MWCAILLFAGVLGVEGYMLLHNSFTEEFRPRSFVGGSFTGSEDVGEMLFLTPILHKGDFKEAQVLSNVQPEIGGTKSYSGYFTVDEKCESNLFFWFFPAQKNWEEAPVVLWLQGGPGASSLYGLFEELGPFSFSQGEGLQTRNFSWNVKNNLLFIDQPVGTGFSFSRKGCYAKNGSAVGNALYEALVQFYQLFPNLVNNKFFITGESYAGHYIPVLGTVIHEKNSRSGTSLRINLSGMMIGNGWMDVVYQMEYGDYLYQLGLLDGAGRAMFQQAQRRVVEKVRQQEWQSAFENAIKIRNLYKSLVGNISWYNYLESGFPLDGPWTQFMQESTTRRALQVGKTMFFAHNPAVYFNLQEDSMKSVAPLVEQLLNHYPLVIYNGQLDIICAHTLVSQLLRSLRWSGRLQFQTASRRQWCVNGQLAGYITSGHNLHEVMVRDASHMVPQAQPLWAFTLVNSVTSAPPGDPLHALSTCQMPSNQLML